MAWRRTQKSALDHPAFSSRIAISGEIAAWPFKTRDKSVTRNAQDLRRLG